MGGEAAGLNEQPGPRRPPLARSVLRRQQQQQPLPPLSPPLPSTLPSPRLAFPILLFPSLPFPLLLSSSSLPDPSS